jgi:hypothetical protein
MFWPFSILFLVLLSLLSLGTFIGSRRVSRKIKLLLVSAIAAGLTLAMTMTVLISTSSQKQKVGSATSPSRGHPAPQHRAPQHPAPLATPQTTPSDIENLQAAVDALPIGQILFNHPAEMELKQAETVRVRISQSLLEDLSHDLKAGGKTEQDQIPVSASMRVDLFGEPYFIVKPLTEEEQLITQKGFSEWSFTVIPQKRGTWPLHLTVSAVIHAPWGGDKFKSYPVKDEEIRVRVTLLGAVGDFVIGNWQWLWTTILVPVSILCWRKIRSRRAKEVTGSSPPKDKQATAA